MASWLNKWYMVNDKMVNGFMEKKKYSNPMMEIAPITTSHLLDSSMNTLPPQVGAPARWKEPVQLTPVF